MNAPAWELRNLSLAGFGGCMGCKHLHAVAHDCAGFVYHSFYCDCKDACSMCIEETPRGWQ